MTSQALTLFGDDGMANKKKRGARRKYTSAEVAAALNGAASRPRDKTMDEVAAELDITVNRLFAWRARYRPILQDGVAVTAEQIEAADEVLANGGMLTAVESVPPRAVVEPARPPRPLAGPGAGSMEVQFQRLLVEIGLTTAERMIQQARLRMQDS